MYYSILAEKNQSITNQQLNSFLTDCLHHLGKKKNILIIPPDFTRYHSMAGKITELCWKYYKDQVKCILPALGTHIAMSKDEISTMFGQTPVRLFKEHNWRKDVVTLGEVPKSYIEEISENKVSFGLPIEVNKEIIDPKYDLILSIGQVVPHEVIGMANYNKNIFVGAGGAKGINKSHFLGAAFGMERIMGRAMNPVRKALNYGSDHFTGHLPIVYVQTVIGKDVQGHPALKGVFIGDSIECFLQASQLSLELNFERLETPLDKVVVYLPPEEFKSTWLGNKAIYRTRMAIADGGELIILAPGVVEFGEDKEIDKLIRKYGYKDTKEILDLTERNADLQNNLGAAAHLIHGSSEGRFRVTYCTGHLSKKEIESVNYRYASLTDMMEKYDPSKLKDGYNELENGEKIFFISNPALGLWATNDKFNEEVV